MSRAPRIEDYAVIGDGQTMALVSRRGSIDWLCWPRFDSAACFASLLGTVDHGRWQIAPRGRFRATRRYRDDSLILETCFETDSGAVTLIDFMPPRGEASDVVRVVRGERGDVDLHMDLTVRFDYGSALPWVTQKRASDAGGINELTAIAGPDRVVLRTCATLQGRGKHTVADFSVKAGERMQFVLTYSASHLETPKAIDVEAASRDTEAW